LTPKKEDLLEDVITTSEERETGDQFIEISVEEPQKMGEGMTSFLAYK
jgi:hypothetical protein